MHSCVQKPILHLRFDLWVQTKSSAVLQLSKLIAVAKTMFSD